VQDIGAIRLQKWSWIDPVRYDHQFAMGREVKILGMFRNRV
jgi:hypothetical protein